MNQSDEQKQDCDSFLANQFGIDITYKSQECKYGVIEPTFRKLEITPKGWGEERLIVNNNQYCGKLLCFNKGYKMSLHMHKKKSESFLCFSGRLIFRYLDLTNADKKEKIIEKDMIIDIPQCCPHQLEALEDSVIIEISSTDYIFDSYRIEKGHSQLNNK